MDFLPPLGPDDVLAVPVSSGSGLPSWLDASSTPPVSPELLRGALADTGNKGRAGTLTAVPIAGRRPRSVAAVGIGEATLPDLRTYVAIAVRRPQTRAEHRARRHVRPVDGPAAPAARANQAALSSADNTVPRLPKPNRVTAPPS